MFRAIEYYGKRVIAYPLILFGWALTSIAGLFILFGAWFLDRDDVVEMMTDNGED